MKISLAVEIRQAFDPDNVWLLSGNIRYVYVGSQPLEDFRYVCVDRILQGILNATRVHRFFV